MPISGRTARAARRTAASALGVAITWPLMVTLPSDGSSSSARHRSRVVLPDPLGPPPPPRSAAETARQTAGNPLLVPKALAAPWGGDDGRTSHPRAPPRCPCEPATPVGLAL